mgnify:CR=1 FL=1
MLCRSSVLYKGIVRRSLVSRRVNSSAHNQHIKEAILLATEYPSDFTLQYPPRREYYKELYRTPGEPKYLHQVIGDSTILNNKVHYPLTDYDKKLLLYCHIPFCEHKCFYCNFAVDTRTNQNQLHDLYVSHMIEGLKRIQCTLFDKNNGLEMSGIDIGGGTPTILEARTLSRFLEALRPIRDACTHPNPLSIETTPAIASKHMDRLYALKEGGVDRVSMGMQSTDDDLLTQMNRGKEATLSSQAVKNIQQVGFKRFSVDVIFGLPNQMMKHWRNDLQRVVDLGIDIVTTYDCLYRGKGRAMTKKSSIPSPEAYGEFYDYGYQFLTSHGFKAPYGSVNFSRHEGETGTSAYFEGRLLDGLQFLGLGNYASSVYAEKWWFAPYSVDQWQQDISDFPEGLPNDDVHQLSEYFPLGDCYTLPLAERAAKYILLSLSFGIIDPARFYHIFSMNIHEVYHESLQFAVAQNFIWLDDSSDCYYIVPGQFKNMPKLRALFYSHNAIKWLQNVRDNPRDQFKHRLQAAKAKQENRMARAC